MQATSRRATATAASSEYQAVVESLYDVAVASRRLSRRDPIDTAGLRLLWHLAEAGSCRPSDLAELADLDLSTVSRHVRDLGDAGFLTRAHDQHDRRAVVLELSAEGQAVLAQSLHNRVAAIAPVLDSWQPADRVELVRLLRALADDLTITTTTPRPSHDTEDPA